MGFYINPPDMTKEEWLREHGVVVPSVAIDDKWLEGALPVCLVDNGWMKAAGVAYCRAEAAAFLYPDQRPKTWYFVMLDDLQRIMDEHSFDHMKALMDPPT